MNYIATITEEMFRWFDIFNSKYFEGKLDKPIITVQKAKSNNYGHFTLGRVWVNSEKDSQYEINIAAHSLKRSVDDIAGTVLHEMIHYYHKVNDIKDCSQNKHNKKFKSFAEKLGFVVEQSKSYGWGHTEIAGELKEFIHNELKPNSDMFTYSRIVPLQDAATKVREKKSFKYTCPKCGLVVKAEADKNINCGDCNETLECE